MRFHFDTDPPTSYLRIAADHLGGQIGEERWRFCRNFRNVVILITIVLYCRWLIKNLHSFGFGAGLNFLLVLTMPLLAIVLIYLQTHLTFSSFAADVRKCAIELWEIDRTRIAAEEAAKEEEERKKEEAKRAEEARIQEEKERPYNNVAALYAANGFDYDYHFRVSFPVQNGDSETACVCVKKIERDSLVFIEWKYWEKFESNLSLDGLWQFSIPLDCIDYYRIEGELKTKTIPGAKHTIERTHEEITEAYMQGGQVGAFLATVTPKKTYYDPNHTIILESPECILRYRDETTGAPMQLVFPKRDYEVFQKIIPQLDFEGVNRRNMLAEYEARHASDTDAHP